MKKLFLPVLFIVLLPLSYSCGTKIGGYTLNERDATTALRQLLSIGARGGVSNSFSKETIMAAIFPGQIQKAMNTLSLLGLTGEVDRFTTSLSTAAERTASASVPIFVNGIENIRFTDALSIIKGGGTSATDYLKNSISDTLRRAVKPIMQSTLNEYKLNEQWNKIVKPAQSIFGNKFSPDLAGIMSVLVTDAMFRKMAEQEALVRTDVNARTTPLLQKVFSRSW